ncbi:Gfo/Idh/MocA family protein [Microbacterium timonense]|uniref:Gfo/Idh/MocA family protein n=1 Tax=Microbacterium timonense TaxID=2086576 RepID=UPI000D0F31F1|nr:Gfo/Idh/MocA family oxidoreductase [Microbacterium timonense]
MPASEGARYAPSPMPRPVVDEGEFVFAAAHLDHGHIYGMSEGLLGAGATLKWVFDPDPTKVAAFRERFPQVQVARSEAEILDDDAVHLVAGAAVTSERAGLGLRTIAAGKDYFTDKAPLTTFEQLAAVRHATAQTGRKYAVYYSERIHVEAAVLAGQLVDQGAIGRVLQVIGLGPHRIGDPATRPAWFFEKEKYGGILCDIGSHNFEQILHYTGAKDAEILSSSIANYAHPEFPELDDYGDAHVVTDNGATGFVRVDWFTPDGLGTWGDGRTILLGTDGYIELRKYTNIATNDGPGQLFLVDGEGEHRINATGTVGYPFFGELILDCLQRTETAMTQEHALKAAELSLRAQAGARVLDRSAVDRAARPS